MCSLACGRDNEMLARIKWIPKNLGGRSKPPLGTGSPPYAAVVRYCDSIEDGPPQVAWSLVIEKVHDLDDPLEWMANIRYLVEDAPQEELRPNRRFELYEGRRCVATGYILNDEHI